MDKAARAVRRSSVKLMSLGGGHTDLHVLLSEVKDMRNTAKAFMNAQNAVSQDFLKWAVKDENRAMQDVANQLAELNLIWTEVQREFGEHLKDYRHMFEMILEGEKHVAQSKNHFATCEQREVKVRKELKKAFKNASPPVVQSLEGRLAQAERAKDLAQIEVVDRIRENEAVKLIRLKEGLTKLSQAYSDFARKCAIVFDAQQDIVQQLPDVLDRDLEDIKYTGSGATRYRVQQAKEKVRSYRKGSDYKSIYSSYDEPPPPYTLTDGCGDTRSAYPRRRTSEPLLSHTHFNSDEQFCTTLDSTLPPPHGLSDTSSSLPASHPLNNSAPAATHTPGAPEVPADSIILRNNTSAQSSSPSPPTLYPVLEPLPKDPPTPPRLLVGTGKARTGLVDFTPDWDDGYEDDLSGAMGGVQL